MRAPSEKHLEDWIVANWGQFVYDTPQINARRIVARQLTLSTGIPDLIISSKLGIRVIELKKGVVDGAAVAQVIRYVGEIEQLYAYATSCIESPNDPHYCDESQMPSRFFPIVAGVLIGYEFDKNALLACYTNNIQAWEYDFDGIGYTFGEAHTEADINYLLHQESDLGAAFKEVMRHRRLYCEDVETLKAIYREEGSL